MTADAVERAALAMQVENHPKPDPLNRDQREEQDEQTLPAYRALARVALAAARAGEAVDREVILAAVAGFEPDDPNDMPHVRESIERTHGATVDRVLAALAARGSAAPTDPREVAHIECNCVPDLGPSHCHLCSERMGREAPWSVVHAGPTVTAAQVTEAAGLLWEHQTGWRRDQAPASAMDDRRRQVRRVLGVVGIEELP